VAVYLLSFGEGTDILEAAAGEPDCGLVNWYGSSAFAKSGGLIVNGTAANFAMDQMFRCPSFAPDPAAIDLWEPFSERLQVVLGREPEVYALTSNDAVWLMAHAQHEQYRTTDIESFKSALEGVAAYQFGITGRLLFNEYGDREQSTYDFWGLSSNGTSVEWQSFGQFSSTDGLTIY
jgi:ABC-type branched-subunit amino acid transport system substrate-binding protein